MENAPAPVPGSAPTIAPTPNIEPTPGPLPLAGPAHSVATVEIIGQPVRESGPLNALHLAEVITYRYGTKPDIVGYDPEGKGFVHGGDHLFAERSLGSMTPEQYIASGRERYSLKIEPTTSQSLDQLVARQEHAWKQYDANAHVPEYDFAGNDAALHNSNSAMVASIEQAGRPDIANRLRQDLEPPAQMQRLEREGLSPEAAGMALTVERRIAGQPSAPGASRSLTPDQVDGTATAAPMAVTGTVGEREIASAFEALKKVSHLPTAAARFVIERRDLLSLEGTRGNHNFPVMRTEANGEQTIEQRREPFTQPGTILSADGDRITQNIGQGKTFTYRTEDVLRNPQTAEEQLRTLESAASNREYVSLTIGPNATQISLPNEEQDRARHR